MQSRLAALKTLLASLEEPRSCFLLGAGASTPTVPTTAAMRPLLRARLRQTGIFLAVPIDRDFVADRLLGPARSRAAPRDDSDPLWETIYARHLSPAAVHATAIALLRPETPRMAPPSYHVFSRAKHVVKLVNFNNDGLADEYCKRHAVINIHGTSLSAEQRRRLDWEQWIDALQEFPRLQGVEIPGLLLPQIEPPEIVNTPPYRAARVALRTARRLIIVGYSFGNMDDAQAYELVRSTIHARRIPTIVLSPDAQDLALRLSDDGECSNVQSLPLYWDKLSAAIIASTHVHLYKSCAPQGLCARCVSYLYDAFLDGSVSRYRIDAIGCAA